MASPSSTPVYVIDADYHESGRLHSLAILRLYEPTGVAMKVFVAEDTAEQEEWLLRTLSSIFTRTIRRIAGWDTHRTVMPALLQRYFRCAVPFPWYYQDRFGPRYRYSDSEHLDLKDFFSEYGVSSGIPTLPHAFRLVGDIQAESWSSPLRVLASGVLAARSDLVTGRIYEDVHARTLANLHDSVVASLDLGLMEGRTEDALGVVFTDYWRDVVTPAYTLFVGGFHG
jgi:hypothetical protein